MVVLCIALFLLLGIFAYVLFAPFYLEIDTDIQLYRLRFHRFSSMTLHLMNDNMVADLQVAWWRKQITLFPPQEAVVMPKKKTASRQQRATKISWVKTMAMMRSFRVRQCYINIDTGDVQWNGILFPLFYLLETYSEKPIRINFMDNNVVRIKIENNLASIGWAYLHS